MDTISPNGHYNFYEFVDSLDGYSYPDNERCPRETVVVTETVSHMIRILQVC